MKHNVTQVRFLGASMVLYFDLVSLALSHNIPNLTNA